MPARPSTLVGLTRSASRTARAHQSWSSANDGRLSTAVPRIMEVGRLGCAAVSRLLRVCFDVDDLASRSPATPARRSRLHLQNLLAVGIERSASDWLPSLWRPAAY